MKSGTEKNYGARVRVSRAKSRVEAQRKAKADLLKERRRLSNQARNVSSRVGRQDNDSTGVTRSWLDAIKKKDVRRREAKRERKKAVSIPCAEKAPAASGSPVSRAGGAGKQSRMSKKGEFRKGAQASHRRERARSNRDETSRGRKDASITGIEDTGGKKRGTSPVRILILGLLLVVSLAALLWIYTSTGVLNVKAVEIEGNEVLDAGYLRSLSGITGDTHLIKMNVKAVEKAILSEPYVASVEISRSFPNTVVLKINERKPIGFIFQNGKYNLVDEEGIVLESTDSRPQGLVEIKDLGTPLLLPGTQISGPQFSMASTLLTSLPASLEEIITDVGFREGIGLYVEGRGTVVFYGEIDELERKNTIAYLALVGLVDRYGALEYIDISFPDHPVIKPASAS